MANGKQQQPKRRWCVRIVQWPGRERLVNPRLPGVWMEQLSHMGSVQVIKPWDGTAEGTEVFEFICPVPGINEQQWADSEAERMRSFGISAAAAPMWKTGDAL
jgi:hypothetical protein